MSDEKKCPDCGTELVDRICPKCGRKVEDETSSSKNRTVFNTGSGWGARINREPSLRTSGGGFCNG